jgi:membrane protein YdbS with pleckstrin-like domain
MGPDDAVVTEVPGTPDSQGWVRLHPLTPLLRGARFGIVLLFLVGQQGLRQESPYAPLLVLLVGVPVGAAFAYVAWRAMRYRVTATELQVESGVLTKRSRRVPLARLQAVDVVRPLVARALGLAELRLEVAGGGDTEAPLAYLSEDDADRLRVLLLDLAAGRRDQTAPAGAAAPPEAPERVLVAVPPGPLVGSVLLGAPLATVVLLVPCCSRRAWSTCPSAAGWRSARSRWCSASRPWRCAGCSPSTASRSRSPSTDCASSTGCSRRAAPPSRRAGCSSCGCASRCCGDPSAGCGSRSTSPATPRAAASSRPTTSALLPVAPKQLGRKHWSRACSATRSRPRRCQRRERPLAGYRCSAPGCTSAPDDRHDPSSCYGVLTRVTAWCR